MKTWIKSLLIMLLAAMFILPANAALQAVGPVSASNGYPLWYQDTNGTALQLCLAGPDGLADTNCALVAEPGIFDPALPIVFPGNFPSESFYWSADSLMNIRGGKALLVLALEAAFASADGNPAPGQQIVFGRVRIRIDAPVAGTYIVTHPYGVDTFNVTTPGIRAISFTEDIGTGVFSGALGSRIGPFLTAVNPAPPVGYVGNPLIDQTVTGSPFDFFRVEGPPGSNLDGAGHDFIQTNLFNVIGKIFKGPIITGFAPASPVSNIQGEARTFNITVDNALNITWYINGNLVQTNISARVNTTFVASGLPPGADVQFILNGGDSVFAKADAAGTATYRPLLEGTLEIIVMQSGTVINRYTIPVLPEGATQASYTNTSAAPGTWNVSAVARNPNGTAVQTWVWEVSVLGAPLVISSVPPSPVISVAGETATFNVTLDQTVDITWYINGNPVQTSTGVTQDSYTNTSAGIGTWDVSAVAQNANGTVTKRWVWEVSMPISAANGYPLWYQDANGLKLDLCLAGPDGLADPKCLLPLAGEEPNFNPALPIVFPGNFPSESFYWSADSLITLPAGGKALLVLALEAAFASPAGDPAPDQQIVFGRVRIRIDAPVAGTYIVTHPYGVDTFNVTTPGIRAISFTEDIGCFGPPCDFRLALGSRIHPFLTAVSPVPPAGYIGDPLIEQTVTGSPFNTNFFRIQGPNGSNLGGPGNDTIESDLFTVQGRIFNDTAATVPAEIPLPIDTATSTTTATATAVSPSGNVTVTIPGGTLVTDATGAGVTNLNVTINTITALPLNAGAALGADQGIVGEVVELGPAGTAFDPQIQVRFNYTDAQLAAAGITAASLKVMFFNTTTNAWEQVPATLNEQGQFVLANISHFSTFALIGTVTPVITAAIAGTVTDAATGTTIAGAIVTAGLAEATTDAEGVYRIELAPGIYTVTASKPGFVTSTTSVTAASGATYPLDFALQHVTTTYKIALDPAAPVVDNTLTATVLKNGVAQQGILVRFILNGGTPISDITDTLGRASFIPPAPGTLDIRASTMDGVPLVNKTVQVIAAQPAALTSIAVSPQTAALAVGGTAVFTATALDQNNNPMAGINIAWTSSNIAAGSVAPANAVTGADGTASSTFTASGAGTATVAAANGSVVGSATVTVSPTPAEAGEVSRGGGPGGGTGGGGITTSEPYENIEKAESHDKDLIAGSPVAYVFTAPELGIYQIIVTGKVNEYDITVRVEALKGTSKLAASPPPGIVYKNMNIWAGTKQVKDVLIKFRVADTWLGSNSIARNEVVMVKWDGSKWVQLETRETGKDGEFTHYEAKTDGFSVFAITGIKAAAPPATPAITETRPRPTAPPAAVPTEKAPGFGVVLAIAAICVLYMLRRKGR